MKSPVAKNLQLRPPLEMGTEKRQYMKMYFQVGRHQTNNYEDSSSSSLFDILRFLYTPCN